MSHGKLNTHTPLGLLRAFVRYETHGGYAWAMVTADGELLCETCAKANYGQVYRETRDYKGGAGWAFAWACVGLTNSGESECTERCCQCDKVLWEVEE